MPNWRGKFLPIEAVLTTLAGGKLGKTNEKWRKFARQGGVERL